VTGVRTVADGFAAYSAWANDPVPRIPFGLPFFDGPTGGGIARAESAMIMSYSSVGKTTIGLNIVRNNPLIPTIVFSLEMSWRLMVPRLAAMDYGISTQAMEQEVKASRGFNPYAQGVTDKYRWLVCDDTSAIDLRQAAESYKRAAEILGTPPRLIIWDYLELIGGSGLMTKTEAVDRAAQRLRDFHKDRDASGIVMHQVGKTSGTGGYEPLSLDSGRYGGHQPMDYVVGAYAPRLNPELTEFEYLQHQPELYLQLLKNRNGSAAPVGVKHRQDPVSMRVTPWTEPQLTTGYTPRFSYGEEH